MAKKAKLLKSDRQKKSALHDFKVSPILEAEYSDSNTKYHIFKDENDESMILVPIGTDTIDDAIANESVLLGSRLRIESLGFVETLEREGYEVTLLD